MSEEFQEDDTDGMGHESELAAPGQGPQRPKITRAEVAKILGISKATVRRYEKRGVLKPCEVSPIGVNYFNLTDVEALSDLGIADDSEEEKAGAQAAEVMTKLVQSGLAHAEKSAALYFGPTERVIAHYKELVDSMSARIKELEATHLELFKAREDALDGQVERSIHVNEQMLKQQSRQQVIQKGLQTLPLIVTAIAEKIGMSKMTAKLTRFLQVLDKDKLEVLLRPETGLLSDEERAALQDLVGEHLGTPTPSPEIGPVQDITPAQETGT